MVTEKEVKNIDYIDITKKLQKKINLTVIKYWIKIILKIVKDLNIK